MIFTQKGYKASRTREIGEEAGTNLALLNYYFGRTLSDVWGNLLRLAIFALILNSWAIVSYRERMSIKLLKHNSNPTFYWDKSR